MRKIKGLLIVLLGLLLITSCNKKKVTLEVNASLTLQVEGEVKLTVNHVAKDLEFSGMGDVVSVRTDGDDVYIKGLKAGNVDIKVTYKPNKKITATVKVTVTPKAVEQGYTLNFSVTVPEGFTGDVYVLGGFNNWNLEAALKLTKGADGKYTGSATFDTDATKVEYKYFNHNEWEYGEGNKTGGYRGNREVNLSETTVNLNDEVLSWEKVYDGIKPDDPKEYTFTFNVTVPEGTEGNVYVVGNFTNWLNDPSTPLQLTKGDDNTYSGTITYTTNKSLLYKYVNAKDLASINWDYEEEVSGNRELTLEALTANDTVTAWKKGGYKEGALEKEYTLNFKVTVPFQLPEGYKVWVVGFNGSWDEEDAVELVVDGLEYYGEVTVTTDASQIEYMVLTGQTFTWDHKPLKEDNSEYGYGENLKHILVEGLNEVNYVVHAWKDLSENQGEPQEYTFTFNVTVPEGTEGNVFVAGNFTNWLDDPSTPLQLTKGEENTYSGTVKYTTNIALSYKYVNAKDLESINWDYEEIVEGDRTLTIADLVANDTVSAWKGGGYKEAAVEKEYTLNFKVTVPFELPEGYKVWVVGFNGSWNEEANAIELVPDGLDYFGEVIITTSATQIEYMVLTGQTFTWDHKPLKEDNSEYGYGENIIHVLVEALNEVNYVVHAWKDLTEEATEQTYTLTFNVTVPEGTEGSVFVVGSFTNWLDDPSTPLQLTKNTEGKFSGSVEYTTVATSVKYKYLNGKDLESLNYDFEEIIEGDRTLVLETPTANDTVGAWKGGGYKEGIVPEMVEVVVRLISVPETTGEFPIKLIGNMTNDWDVTQAVIFEKVLDAYEATITVDKNATNEFKLYLDKGQAEWHEHQASPDGIEEFGNRVIREEEYTALLVKMGIPQWKGLTPTDPESEIVNIVVRLTSIPETTGEFPIKLIGSMTGWSVSQSVVFEKVLDAYEVTLDVEKNVENKFCLYLDKGQATWHDHQAADELGVALADHVITAEEYTALLVEIAVPNWKGLTPPEPEVEYTLNFSFNINVYIPEGYKVFLIGDFNGWDEPTAVELVGESGLYAYQTTYVTDKTQFGYMIVTGETFTWAHKTLKPDNSQYGNMENITHDLVEGANAISYIVPGWAGITPPTPPEMVDVIIRLTSVPTTTETYPIKLIGSMTSWDVTKSMVFEKVLDAYEVTLSVDKNIENKFVLYLDKEQATWHDHQAASEGVALPDHIITAEEYTLGLVEMSVPEWKGLIPEYVPNNKLFTVKLGEIPGSTETYPIKLIGSMTNDWNVTEALIFEEVDGILQVSFTIDYNLSSGHLFKVYLDKNQTNWHDHQAASTIGNAWDDYVLTYDFLQTNTEVTLNIPYWLGLENPPTP